MAKKGKGTPIKLRGVTGKKPRTIHVRPSRVRANKAGFRNPLGGGSKGHLMRPVSPTGGGDDLSYILGGKKGKKKKGSLLGTVAGVAGRAALVGAKKLYHYLSPKDNTKLTYHPDHDVVTGKVGGEVIKPGKPSDVLKQLAGPDHAVSSAKADEIIHGLTHKSSEEYAAQMQAADQHVGVALHAIGNWHRETDPSRKAQHENHALEYARKAVELGLDPTQRAQHHLNKVAEYAERMTKSQHFGEQEAHYNAMRVHHKMAEVLMAHANENSPQAKRMAKVLKFVNDIKPPKDKEEMKEDMLRYAQALGGVPNKFRGTSFLAEKEAQAYVLDFVNLLAEHFSKKEIAALMSGSLNEGVNHRFSLWAKGHPTRVSTLEAIRQYYDGAAVLENFDEFLEDALWDGYYPSEPKGWLAIRLDEDKKFNKHHTNYLANMVALEPEGERQNLANFHMGVLNRAGLGYDHGAYASAVRGDMSKGRGKPNLPVLQRRHMEPIAKAISQIEDHGTRSKVSDHFASMFHASNQHFNRDFWDKTVEGQQPRKRPGFKRSDDVFEQAELIEGIVDDIKHLAKMASAAVGVKTGKGPYRTRDEVHETKLRLLAHARNWMDKDDDHIESSKARRARAKAVNGPEGVDGYGEWPSFKKMEDVWGELETEIDTLLDEGFSEKEVQNLMETMWRDRFKAAWQAAKEFAPLIPAGALNGMVVNHVVNNPFGSPGKAAAIGAGAMAVMAGRQVVQDYKSNLRSIKRRRFHDDEVAHMEKLNKDLKDFKNSLYSKIPDHPVKPLSPNLPKAGLGKPKLASSNENPMRTQRPRPDLKVIKNEEVDQLLDQGFTIEEIEAMDAKLLNEGPRLRGALAAAGEMIKQSPVVPLSAAAGAVGSLGATAVTGDKRLPVIGAGMGVAAGLGYMAKKGIQQYRRTRDWERYKNSTTMKKEDLDALLDAGLSDDEIVSIVEKMDAKFGLDEAFPTMRDVARMKGPLKAHEKGDRFTPSQYAGAVAQATTHAIGGVAKKAAHRLRDRFGKPRA